jgi:hypothetical protein
MSNYTNGASQVRAQAMRDVVNHFLREWWDGDHTFDEVVQSVLDAADRIEGGSDE